MSEHGNCPGCGTDLNGGSICQTFFDKYGSEAEADRADALAIVERQAVK